MAIRSLDFENVLVSGRANAAPALLVDQQLVATALTAETPRPSQRELLGSFDKFSRITDLVQLGTLVPKRKGGASYARADSKLPISPTPAASDLLIYEHASDPTIR